ncbi:MAG TPA: amino acid permease, partial [archaeon]|nr:amino acid permease [archaeon]
MQLKQTIGKKTLLMLVVNAILGTGIFFLPAVGAAYSGSASILAWMMMSIIAIVISIYFAELVSMFPKSGGAYEFVKNAFGKSYGFVF